MSQFCRNAMIAFSLVVTGFPASAASAKVSARVYLADEVTPLALADPNVPEVYRDIMVGTKLTIFITSDTAELWDGALWLSQENWAKGTLSGRGYDQKSKDYRDSHLQAAGGNAGVTMYTDPAGVYLVLLSSRDSAPGEWFALDYEAHAVGTCNIGLYAYDLGGNTATNPDPRIGDPPPPFEANLIQVLFFQHVPSRDYSGDALVNFVDFAWLASFWKETAVSDPNALVLLDLNADDRIDVSDVALFGEYWLERTEAGRLTPEPNDKDVIP